MTVRHAHSGTAAVGADTLTGLQLIETPRLYLRPPIAADWSAYWDYRQSPRSSAGRPMPRAEAWTHFAAFFGHWALRGYGRLIAVLKSNDQPLGHFGPFFPDGHPERELTWTLWDAAQEGTGLAFEAARAVHTHAFTTLGWDTAVSYIDPANHRSQALARRLGARLDTAAPNPYGDATQVWRHVAGQTA